MRTKSINGYIGRMIQEYLCSKCPDMSPLVYPYDMPGRDTNYQWRVYIPDLTAPGQVRHAIYRPAQNQLIKEFCDELLTAAGYDPEIQRSCYA